MNCAAQFDASLRSIPDNNRLIRFVPHTRSGELAILNAWFPTATPPNNLPGTLIHVSSIRYLDCTYRFGDPRCKQLARTHLEECLDGFRYRIKRGSNYPWSRLFSSEFQEIEYQLAGMDRLWSRLAIHETGCLLADDVGLGKTVQSIAMYLRGVAEKRIAQPKYRGVYVTKASLKIQLGQEIRRFAPRLRVAVAEGTYAERTTRLQARSHILVVNYDMFVDPRYKAILASILANETGLVVLDEAARLKNPNSKTHNEIINAVAPVPMRLVMDATPLENSVLDCWGKLRATDRLLLGSESAFASRYLKIVNGRVTTSRNLKEFRERTASIVLRRTRKGCGVQVPEVHSVIRSVRLGSQQASRYRSLTLAYRACPHRGAVGLSALHKVCMAGLVADASDPKSPSAKLDDLIELLETELSTERIVIFTRYAEIAAVTMDRLRNFDPLLVSGKVSLSKREENRELFNDPDSRHRILVCTEAGDSGLNLQGGGVVVNLDLPWNAAKLRQRVGRINRIGQKRASVLVLNYHATLPGKAKTVDDWLVKTVISKRDIFRLGVGDDLTLDEIGNESISEDGLKNFLGSA